MDKLILVVTAVLIAACGQGFKALDNGGRDGSAEAVLGGVAYQPNAVGVAGSASSTPAELMARLKFKSCKALDLLTDVILGGSFDSTVEALGRSKCESLPRAVETWNNPPNFLKVAQNMAVVRSRTGRDFDYGMFIAEAINIKAVYTDGSGKRFDFAAMCKPGSKDQWGPDTCVPYFESPEFVRYVKYIIGKAVDVGVSSILIGQTGYTDPNYKLKALMPELRALAAARGRPLLIGQQPNGNQPADYLRAFDYVMGPSYVGEDVSKACLPKFKNYCQAVLFHPSVLGNANNVISELDYSSDDDDIHRFAMMSQAGRADYLNKTVSGFFRAGVGFVFPMRIILNGGSPKGNCYGQNPYVYQSNKEFGCKDEDVINNLLAGNILPGNSGAKDSPSRSVTRPTATEARKIVIAALQSVLGRTAAEAEVDQPGIAYWVERLTTDITTEQFHAELRASNEYYVKGLYTSILKRVSTLSEMNYWIGQLNTGAKSRAKVKADIQAACDNHSGGECGGVTTPNVPTTPTVDYEAVVIKAYVSTLGRTAAEAKADTSGVAYWAGRLKAGLSQGEFIASLRASNEYYVRYNLYVAILKRNPSLNEMKYWIQQLESGAKTRAKAKADFNYVCQNKIGGECK